MPIDYSKWKDIEVSDDEDDTHPNIDTASLFRWRHQARLERMANQKQEREGIEDGKKKVLYRLKDIEERLLDTNITERERINLELEMQEFKKQEDEFLKKEEELAEKERLQPWNIDTIGHEGWSKTLINKPKEKSNVSEPKENDEESSKKLSKYVEDNEELLNQFSVLDDLDEAEIFLMEHPYLASDYASSYLAIEALNCAIVEDYAKMDKIAVNCITLQYLLEFAKMLHAIASNTSVIRNFFKKIRQADPGYMKMYRDEVDAFRERLCKRAREKRQAAVEEMESEAKQKRIAESPGGLDPQEVLDSLPQDMQEAFQTQSIEKMYHVAESMDPEVFKYHMQRCVDSGLWVPNTNKSGNNKDDTDGEGTSSGCAVNIGGSGEALAAAVDD